MTVPQLFFTPVRVLRVRSFSYTSYPKAPQYVPYIMTDKELKKLKDQAEELSVYEEKIHHWADKMEPMNLDDGVKANYAKFQELLTKIK